MPTATRRPTSSGSRSRKSGGTSKGSNYFWNVVWFLALGGAIIAFFLVPPSPTASGIWEGLTSRAQTVQAWAVACGDGAFNDNIDACFGIDLGGGSGGNGDGSNPNGVDPDSFTKDQAIATLGVIAIADRQQVNYNRDEWNHWISYGNGCWNVREQVLLTEARSIVLLDGAGNVTTDPAAACAVQSGEWVDAYTGATFTDPGTLDIDHMIPLSYAAAHGGQAWNAEQKQNYANSLDFSNHLIAVDASQNRTKGDKGPGEWMPPDRSYHCDYAKSWVAVANNWGLTISAADKAELEKALASCVA